MLFSFLKVLLFKAVEGKKNYPSFSEDSTKRGEHCLFHLVAVTAATTKINLLKNDSNFADGPILSSTQSLESFKVPLIHTNP